MSINPERGLSVKRLAAEPREPDVDQLAREIANRLPMIDLPDLLIEVDPLDRLHRSPDPRRRRPTAPRRSRPAPDRPSLQSRNRRMARASDLSAASIGWTSEWYLRHETLEAATALIVDHQSTIPLAQCFGSGAHSSSDGKRRIVSPDSQQTRRYPGTSAAIGA